MIPRCWCTLVVRDIWAGTEVSGGRPGRVDGHGADEDNHARKEAVPVAWCEPPRTRPRRNRARRAPERNREVPAHRLEELMGQQTKDYGVLAHLQDIR
ncbi:hypothetical protein GCM10010977_09330 [Citricoccus zhacaiensis]|uniref:Uncharacterized protein n=1 Tax=Citricoccus zhacaiensis TaxID=489142 RepID=A0ABQ2LS96_9MICC|nr:hypothetical protein GCM10010977_09330 [Citricoccus zhacaiensis]